MITTVTVYIGLKQYVAVKETMEVAVRIPDKWNYDGPLSFIERKGYWKMLKFHTPKWYEIRQVAFPRIINGN
jgi:hypothetical protein